MILQQIFEYNIIDHQGKNYHFIYPDNFYSSLQDALFSVLNSKFNGFKEIIAYCNKRNSKSLGIPYSKDV